MTKNIAVQKTDFNLPVILVLHCDIDLITHDLKQYVSEEQEVYAIPCVLSIKECSEPTFLARLLDVLRQLNFIAIGIKTEDSMLSEQADFAGLAVFNDKLSQLDLFDTGEQSSSFTPNFTIEQNQPELDIPDKPPYIHHGNVLYGDQVHAEGSDLIVLGNVESGGEVIADGSIYIGGSLNGRAYAGNSGSMNVDLIALKAYVFEPELVSVVGFYQLKEDISDKYLGLPVEVRFKNQKLDYMLND